MQMRSFMLLVLTFLFSTPTFTQNTSSSKRYQGLLWEITGKGTTRPSYLYGTMHVPEKLAFNLSDSFFVALRGVDMVSLETNHDVWQDFMEELKDANEDNAGGYGRNSRYDYTDLYGRSFLFEAPDTRLFEGMFAYKPVMANEFLYRSSGFSEDYEENTYLDLFIFQAGKKLGKQVIGLETMEGSYVSVSRSRIPDDKEDEEEEYSRKYVSPNAIRDAYRKQDLDALDSLNVIMSPGKNFRKYMLDVRNEVMANGIDSIAQSGKTMFSAVGAAHLPGDQGVIEMLRRKGYKVRAVKFSFDTDKKDMSQIDSMHYPVNFTKQWNKDSIWSAEAPGKFYTTSDNWRVEQSLCADMANGAYYAVYHIQTYGLWTGQTPEYISSRIDSIIYERVPGKIQERKKITSPFPGHEITTRTRRGDIQRYKILITPYDIFMFMAGGNGDYMAGTEGNRFFNSISINEKKVIPAKKPVTINPVHGGFTVTFPVEPAVNNTNDEKAGTGYVAAFDNGPDSAYYFVTRIDYHDLDFIEEDTFELNIIGEKIAEQFTKKAPEQRLLSTNPYPSQDFWFRSEKDSSYYFGRIVIDGASYYLVGCRNISGKKPETFFNSFSIKPKTWPEGFAEKNDTTGRFKVLLPKKEEKPPSALFLALKKVGDEMREKSRELYADEYYSMADNDSGVFESNTTGEKVYYFRNEVNAISAPDLDSLKRSMKTIVTSGNALAVKSSETKMAGDTMIIFDFVVQDTNSNRGILSKTIIGSKVRYGLTASVNLDEPRSAFISNIFDSFTPTDTSLHQPVKFGERDMSFLTDIYSADTLTKKKAISQLDRFGSYNFKPEDFDKVKMAIENPGFDKLMFSTKRSLLYALGHTKSPRTLPFLRSFYDNHPDSVRYRETALGAISMQKTKAAFKTLFDLWLESSPYLSEVDYGIINDLHDTLELTKHFVPQLLQLAQVDAYKNNALERIAALHEEGLIKPKDFKSLKNKLIQEVKYDISMNRYNEEQRRDSKSEYGGYRGPHYYQGGGDYYNTDDSDLTLQLLMAFYKDDEKVKALFSDMLRYGDDNLKMNAVSLLIKARQPVPESLVQQLATKDKTRFNIYRSLVEAESLNNYKSLFTDTLALVKSYVVKNVAEEELDSIRFISKHKSVINKQAATLFFFEYKRKKVKEWTLAYVTLPADFGIPKKNNKVRKSFPTAYPSSYDYYGTNYYGDGDGYAVQTAGTLDSEKDKKEFIEKKVGEIRFDGRKRYKSARKFYYDE